MIKLFEILLFRFLGKVQFHEFFAQCFKLSLKGLNYYNTIGLKQTGELEVVKLFFKSSKEKKLIVFDCGAHLGEYKDLFNSFCSNEIKDCIEFHLFEPQRNCIDELVKKYRSERNVFINHTAVGLKESKEIKLYNCEDTTLFAVTFKFDFKAYLPHITMKGTEQTTMTNLFNYCLSNNIKEIDLLKLDVEGHELDCIMSLYRFIESGKISFIQFEYSFINQIRRQQFYDYWELLKPNYNIFRICSNGIKEIEEFNLNYEIAAPINYLAILKEKLQDE